VGAARQTRPTGMRGCAPCRLSHPPWERGNTKLILREARFLSGRYGVRLDYGELHRYLASVCLRSGRRWPALGHLAQAAMRGQARQVVSTLAGLSRHRVANRVAVLRPQYPAARAAWIAEAETWIAPLRDTSP